MCESEDIAAVQSAVDLQPAGTAVTRDEGAAERLIVHDTCIHGFGLGFVEQQGANLAMREPTIGRIEIETAIAAGHHAAAISRQENPLGVARIDHDVIDDQVRR